MDPLATLTTQTTQSASSGQASSSGQTSSSGQSSAVTPDILQDFSGISAPIDSDVLANAPSQTGTEDILQNPPETSQENEAFNPSVAPAPESFSGTEDIFAKLRYSSFRFWSNATRFYTCFGYFSHATRQYSAFHS